MGGRRDYTRWDYDDETELTLEDNGSLDGSAEVLGNATFPPPPNVLSSSSPIRSREISKLLRKTSFKEKAQLWAGVLGLVGLGFMAGFGICVHDRGTHTINKHSKHFSSIGDASSTSPHESQNLIFHELLQQIKAHNIRDNLKQMTKEEHRAGTEEGHSMAIGLRDLWRGYGISVRLEQHKTLLTRTESFNYLEVISKNGTVLFTTSKTGNDINLPIMAFSPSTDFNGTLVYANYGRFEDFQRLQKSQIRLTKSIALIRFSYLHPSTVVSNAIGFGCDGLIFYNDPEDFPQLPKTAIRSASLLTVGQVHEYQKRKGNWTLPSHTVSANDAENLLRRMETSEEAPKEWQGGLNISYRFGGRNLLVRLKIFNEAKTSSIYNVVASIPGSVESDRYVVVGCSHDSWTGSGAADPGIGLAITTEILRAFSSYLATGWRPRRSILVVSFDANLFSASGVSHWLQEHHFEIVNRAVTFIDMTRTLKGNQTLEVFSSPLLKEVARKAINRIKHFSEATHEQRSVEFSNVQWKSVVSCDEPAFTFQGSLGIPFVRLSVSNTPKEDYSYYHTAFDNFDAFREIVDPQFLVSEALGRIIAEIIVLLADSSALPITLHDYTKDIRKEFDHFIAEYHDDFHKANLSYASFQAAVTRLEVIVENFQSQSKNHTAKESYLTPHHKKLRREMQHRILNDKLISLEKALLQRNSDSNDGFKHQIIGHKGTDLSPTLPPLARNGAFAKLKPQEESHLVNKSNNVEQTSTVHKSNAHPHRVFSTEHLPTISHFFPKLRLVLECGRKCESGFSHGDACAESYLSVSASSWYSESTGITATSKANSTSLKHSCMSWRNIAVQRMSSLVRCLDSFSAIIQSPLVAVNLNQE